jgi:hypothetical protein
MTALLGLARRNPNDPETFAGLVHACRYSGLLEASEAAHREARRLDPHIWTSCVYTWWARGEFERLVDETSDAADFQLRAMALEGLGRRPEALRSIEALPTTSLTPVFASLRAALTALLSASPEAADGFASIVAAHSDPEAFFMYATVQAHFGDAERALSRLTTAVERGFSVPQALLDHPWLALLRGTPAFSALLARAEADRALAVVAFREAGGEALLGAAG